jgi:hypothetical protein
MRKRTTTIEIFSLGLSVAGLVVLALLLLLLLLTR